jgi:hypothetical protein
MDGIPQEYIWIILAVIALIAIVVVMTQWRRVRVSHNDVLFADKQLELKKIDLVEKDLESKRLLEYPIPLPRDQQEKLSVIRKSTNELMGKVGFLHSEISERVAHLEAKSEYKKLQKLLKEIEKKEVEIEKNMKKIKPEEETFKSAETKEKKKTGIFSRK